MKALETNHRSFHAPLKSPATFKTLARSSPLSMPVVKPATAGVKAAGPFSLIQGSKVVATGSRGSVQAAHALQSATSGQIVRARVEQEVERLVAARSAHVKTAHQQVEERSGDVTETGTTLTAMTLRQLCSELIEDLSQVELRKSAPQIANSNMPVVSNPLNEARAAAARDDVRALHALRLIEKIDVFVKSQRPMLALTLNNALAAKVEIERVGQQQVALKITGHRGPPPPEIVTRIREAMEAKGLKIAVLQLA